MNLIDRLRIVFGSNPPAQPLYGVGSQQKQTPYVFPLWGADVNGIPSLVDYESYAQEGYAKNAVVFACINEIARTAPSAHLRVVRDMGNSQIEPWEDHPLQAVLDKPNPYQGQKEFFALYYTYLNLDGNCFIIRERKGKRTVQLWLARPDRMRPVIDRRDLMGYVYVAESGERIPYLPEEVIHVKFPNPYDPYEGLGRGLPPLSASALETDVDNQATMFVKKFFQNAAVPFGLLKSKNVMDDAEVMRIRARIREQYVGEGNWWEMMILDTDAEYQRLGLDLNNEMAFPDLRAIGETRICATFKVPPVLLGIKAGLDAATYSNYTQARRALWEDKIIPDNGVSAESLTAALGDELGKNGKLQHDYANVVALQEDRNMRFERANRGVVGGWITVNEARREVGLNPASGGDVFLRMLSSGAAKTPGKEGDLAPEENDPEGQPARDPGTQAIVPAFEKKADEQAGGEFHKAVDRTARAWELKFLNAARERFVAENRELQALARSEKGANRKEIDWRAVERAWYAFVQEKGIPGWAAAFAPLISGLLDEQAENWLGKLGVPWNVQNPLVKLFLQEYGLKFAERIGRFTVERLRSVLIEAQGGGWPITRLIDEVQGIYGEWNFYRAEMIARSETIRASNAGAVEAYRQAQITRKEWFTAEDERVCTFCNEMHGKVIDVQVEWFKQGEVMTVDGEQLLMDYEDVGYPPLHPNCRCTILPVVEG